MAGETLRGVRKTMAERMALSHARVVPVTVTEDADIGDWREGEDVTARLIRAVVAGCAASPSLNAWFDDDAARRTLHRDVHVGIAADTGDGLFVPVLRDAGAQGPAALRAEVDRLRAGVVARSLVPGELDGATITLSNFGMLAGRYGTPVVVPPQVAILGAGRAREEPVVRGGTIAIRPAHAALADLRPSSVHRSRVLTLPRRRRRGSGTRHMSRVAAFPSIEAIAVFRPACGLARSGRPPYARHRGWTDAD